MTYEQKARIFEAALAKTGNVADALRAVSGAGNYRRKLDAGKLARLRELRAEGLKLDAIAAELGVSVATVSLRCRGMRKGAQRAALPPAIAKAIVEVIGRELGLEDGWVAVRQRGNPFGAIGRGKRAAALAMRAAGLTNVAIAAALEQPVWLIGRKLLHGTGDRRAIELADRVPALLASAAPAPTAVKTSADQPAA